MDNLLYPSTQALLLLSATYQIFSFTEIYVTWYYILWNISTGFWSSYLFSFSFPGAKWVDNNQKLTCQCCAPTSAWKNTNTKQTPPSPPSCCVIFSLDCFLKHFRYFIHNYWHTFQKSFFHFVYIFNHSCYTICQVPLFGFNVFLSRAKKEILNLGKL